MSEHDNEGDDIRLSSCSLSCEKLKQQSSNGDVMRDERYALIKHILGLRVNSEVANILLQVLMRIFDLKEKLPLKSLLQVLQ